MACGSYFSVYSTGKKVTIQDRRIRSLNLALNSLVLLYIGVVQIMLFHRYATFEAISGKVVFQPGPHSINFTAFVQLI